MKKCFFILALMSVLPLSIQAQDDDLYFVPKKVVEKNSVSPRGGETTYYIGSDRDVDEYNRRSSYNSAYYEMIEDSINSDVIDFTAGDGLYPDTTYVDSLYSVPMDDIDDFTYTRRMSRYDDFYGWYDPWRMDYWWDYPYWHSYYSWYDPWYGPYGYYGWYGPWYYGYSRWGWYSPYRSWYGGHRHAPSYVAYRGVSGTQNHGMISGRNVNGYHNGRNSSYKSGTFGGSRVGKGGTTATQRTSTSRSRTEGVTTNRYGNFGGNYPSGSNNSSPSRSYSPNTSTYNNGSSGFGGSSTVGGGSRGGSGSFGGGSRSGGGSFGGGRR